MPALRNRRWTLAEVERLADERPAFTPRYELVDGELLVTPAPVARHQRIVRQLFKRLDAYVVQWNLGEVRFGPEVAHIDRDTRFEPDVFVVPSIGGRRPPADDTLFITPLLIAEVLSPGSSRHDRITKRRYFRSHAVPVYWVVDGEAEAFEVWRPEDERAALIDDRLTWHPEGAENAFGMDVREFFAEISDEPRE